MSPMHSFSAGQGVRQRKSHKPPISGPKLQVQAPHTALPTYPFQPLPAPNAPAPYHYDLSQLLTVGDLQQITDSGVMVFHTVGDTGDYRGQQQVFVADMMTQDAQTLPANQKPAFYYHLGDVIYFAGDIIRYPDNFYLTYKDYPGFIVAIPGNHDCQPDDPTDGPGDPNKTPLDGWVRNFMAKDPSRQGSKTVGTTRTPLDLPNVYWTFTTPFATIIGLFSNVGEDEAEIHPDQVAWFQGELKAADPNRALIVTIHHPPFSGDDEHSGSSVADQVLTTAFQATGRYPNLVLSGHVHNYQRFTNVVQGPKGPLQIPYVVAGAGGYTKLSSMQTVNGAPPKVPMALGNGLTLVQYDATNFGFLRLAVSKTHIVGTYTSAPYSAGATPAATVLDTFTVDLEKNTVVTGTISRRHGGGHQPKPKPKKKPKKKSK
jgi:acid phosphatase type 7